MDLTLIWKTLLIGVIEGLTEFLPVSSTGHIILAEEILHFQGPPGKVFEIVIQLGAILAICFLYRAKIFATVSGVLRRERPALLFAAAIIVAFLPAAVVGVAAHKYIKSVLFDPKVVAVSLIVGGIIILIIERFAPRPRIKSVDEIDLKTAFLIGVAQCLAMIPGVSRAGATIMSARVLRVERATAAEFSFSSPCPRCSAPPSTISSRTGRRWTGAAAASSRRGIRRRLHLGTACGRSVRALHQPARFCGIRMVPHRHRRRGACADLPALT